MGPDSQTSTFNKRAITPCSVMIRRNGVPIISSLPDPVIKYRHSNEITTEAARPSNGLQWRRGDQGFFGLVLVLIGFNPLRCFCPHPT